MRESIEFSAYGTRIKIIGGPQDDKLMASALREVANLIESPGREITNFDEMDEGPEGWKERCGENSSMFCEHANEVPSKCSCPNNCYCKSNTCGNK